MKKVFNRDMKLETFDPHLVEVSAFISTTVTPREIGSLMCGLRDGICLQCSDVSKARPMCLNSTSVPLNPQCLVLDICV